MELNTIKELSEKGEKELEEDLAVTPPSGRFEPQFNFEEIDKKFKSFYIRDPIVLLVGSCATQGKGADIDLVMRDEDLPDILKEANRFRLLRQMSGEFGIDYENTPDYLHIHDEAFGSYTSYYPLYRLKMERIPNEQIHKMSLNDDIDESFEILEKSKRRIIAGIASTDALDLEGEKISRKALEKIWKHIESMPDEYRNLMLSHTSTQIGKILMSYKNRKSALLDEGLYLIAELRQDIPIANETWKDILDKKLHSFSIKINIPKPLNKNIKRICDDDKCWMEIRDAFFVEYTLTPSPANTECNKLDILSKDSFNQYV